MSLRAEWKCVSTKHGEQCVITTGILWMAMSSANSLDFNQQVLVCKILYCHKKVLVQAQAIIAEVCKGQLLLQ